MPSCFSHGLLKTVWRAFYHIFFTHVRQLRVMQVSTGGLGPAVIVIPVSLFGVLSRSLGEVSGLAACSSSARVWNVIR